MVDAAFHSNCTFKERSNGLYSFTAQISEEEFDEIAEGKDEMEQHIKMSFKTISYM